jgi:hypothetical protein
MRGFFLPCGNLPPRIVSKEWADKSLPKAYTTKVGIGHLQKKGPAYCREKFLRVFPNGFTDERYLDWERNYKVEAHEAWKELLSKEIFERLLAEGGASEIVARALKIEGKTNLLFSQEKIALRDGLKIRAVAELFARKLYSFIFASVIDEHSFENWLQSFASIPVKQSRVFTWPVTTVFGFIADPVSHMFLKPNVTRVAASIYGYDFQYTQKPVWNTYKDLLSLSACLKSELVDLQPRDMIDLQSFIWVQGSEEYNEWA